MRDGPKNVGTDRTAPIDKELMAAADVLGWVGYPNLMECVYRCGREVTRLREQLDSFCAKPPPMSNVERMLLLTIFTMREREKERSARESHSEFNWKEHRAWVTDARIAIAGDDLERAVGVVTGTELSDRG